MQSNNLSQYDMIAKIVMVGDYGVGKTSIMERFVDQSFRPPGVMTSIGVDFKMKIKLVNHQRLKYQVWDTAGAQRFRSLVNAYYRGAHGILLIFDITKSDALTIVKHRLAQIRQNCAENRNIIVVLFGNKSDLEHQRYISTQSAQEFADSQGLPYMEGSAKQDINISEAFEMMGIHITNNYIPVQNVIRPALARNRRRLDQLPQRQIVEQKYSWLAIGAPALLLTLFVFLALITNN